MLSLSSNIYTLVGAVAAVYYFTIGYRLHGTTAKLRHIPTVGYEHPILYYWSALRFLFDADAVMKAGEDLAAANKGVFKYPGLLKWSVVITDPELMGEIFRASKEDLSMFKGIDEGLQISYSLGKNIAENHYHVEVVKEHLTRGLPKLVPRVHDELSVAIGEIIPSEEWQTMPLLDTVLKIVARASNRVFVGLPLCRDPTWITINIRFTLDVIKTSTLLSMVPEALRPMAASFDNHVQKTIREAIPYLKPEIDARRKQVESGDEEGAYNDFLAWLMADAEGDEKTDKNLTSRILTVNFAAIHTSSMTFTHAMFYLATNQEWVKLLREEAEEVTHRLGWTKQALDELHVIDSFIKESQRLSPLGMTISRRVVLRDWALSNGIMFPAGTSINASIAAGSWNDAYYDDAMAFDPLRFVKLRAAEKTATGRFQIVSTSTTSLTFGHGRYACPGRFFAATEVKLMMALMVMNYDIKLEDERQGKRPDDLWFAGTCSPNRTAKVMFRKRKL